MGIPAIAQKTSNQMLHENRMQNMRDRSKSQVREAENRNKQEAAPVTFLIRYEL